MGARRLSSVPAPTFLHPVAPMCALGGTMCSISQKTWIRNRYPRAMTAADVLPILR